ncbi:MAG: hypothetical protein PWQ31_31 [Eubacteriales bacterium]|nr:hypothetical protein [Eubacteriales bacterium]
MFWLATMVFMNEEGYSLFLNPFFQFFTCRSLKPRIFAASPTDKLPAISWVITISLFASFLLKTILALLMVTFFQKF